MKFVLKWIFGLGCVLFGVLAFKYSIIGGLLFLVSAAFLFPPVLDKINDIGKVNRALKIFIPIIGCFLGSMLVGRFAGDKKKIEGNAKLAEEQRTIEVNDTQHLDSIESTQALRDFASLYDELLDFKSDSKFLQYGFAKDSKYSRWSQRLNRLREKERIDFLKSYGFVLGDLEQLALSYMSNGGRETKETEWYHDMFSEVLLRVKKTK